MLLTVKEVEPPMGEGNFHLGVPELVMPTTKASLGIGLEPAVVNAFTVK
jgi:hypothetical protein